MRLFYIIIVISACLIFGMGHAQTDDTETEEGSQNNSSVTYAPNFDIGTMLSNFTADTLGATKLTALDDRLMGESYDVNSGSISFLQTDVSLPGNSNLPVTFARRATGMSHQGGNVPYASPLGKGWDVDIPYVLTRVDQGESGNCNLVDSENHNFDEFRVRRALDIGTKIYTPGSGERDLGTSLNMAPSNFYNDRKMSTRDHWIATCESDSTGPSGDGYIVKSPDGTTYIFDHIKIRSSVFSLPTPAISVPDDVPVDNIYMMPTEVTDIHGNWVKYEYNSHGVTRIHSKDGREITITYTGALISSVTANNRSWTYSYNNENLSRVTRPDGTYWSFGSNEEGMKFNGLLNSDCSAKRDSDENKINSDGRTIYMIHPNGTEAEFKTRVIVHTVKNVDAGGPFGPAASYGPGNTACVAGKIRPQSYMTRALTKKTLTLSTSENYVWEYDYDQPANIEYTTQSGSKHYFLNTTLANDIKTHTITDPEDYKTVFHISNNWHEETNGIAKLGIIVKKEIFDSAGSTPLRTETTESFVSTNELGGRMTYGTTITGSDYLFLPERKTIEQDGDTWTYEYDYNLDPSSPDFAFTSPILTEVSSNVSSNPRVTDTEYYHDLSNWVLPLDYWIIFQNNDE